MENEEAQTQDALNTQPEIVSTTGSEREETVSVELKEQRWSVITFDNCAARNLTYDEAEQKLRELEKENAVGLCIITDEAAARMNGKKK